MKGTPLHLIITTTAFLQFGVLVVWYIGLCLWAGGEAWLAAIVIGIPGVLITLHWFEQMRSMRPLAWIAAFLWFPATIAVAVTRAHEDYLSHPVALVYATTALVAWLMMWHKTVRPTMRKTWLAEEPNTQQGA